MKTERSLITFALALLFAFAIPTESFAKDTQRIRIDLENTGEEPQAEGKAEFRLKKKRRTEFKVEVEDLTPANYDLVGGGVVRGTLDIRQLPDGRVEGELQFDSKRASAPGRRQPLDFDPRGQPIQVVRSAVAYLEATLPAAPASGSNG
jgi:hypothetical protein